MGAAGGWGTRGCGTVKRDKVSVTRNKYVLEAYPTASGLEPTLLCWSLPNLLRGQI